MDVLFAMDAPSHMRRNRDATCKSCKHWDVWDGECGECGVSSYDLETTGESSCNLWEGRFS